MRTWTDMASFAKVNDADTDHANVNGRIATDLLAAFLGRTV